MNSATICAAAEFEAENSRVRTIDWSAVSADLNVQGWAVLPKLLSKKACDVVADQFDKDENFRSHVIMARHGFSGSTFTASEHGTAELRIPRPLLRSHCGR